MNKSKIIEERENYKWMFFVVFVIALFAAIAGIYSSSKINESDSSKQEYNLTFNLTSCLNDIRDKTGYIAIYSVYDLSGYYNFVQVCKEDDYCKYEKIYLNDNCSIKE